MGQEDISGAGDHFLIGLQPSPALTGHDRILLSDLRPAGVILFKSNFRHDLPYEDWLQGHARLIAEIRAAVRRPAMLIGIDHEGGRVCRTPAPITRFSYAAQWAGKAAVIGSAMGLELASLGVNLSFSPVLDIHTNPRNPVIGERAFGKTPEAVIAAALPFMMAMQRQEILVCGKHFPGHGDTSIDSHLGLPRQNINLEVLRARELKPFAAAIEADIPMIMTSHILFPEVDREHPVTLSHRFLTGILRGELGFEGAIISDDIGMGAMKGFFDGPDSAVRLLQCGCDMVMVCSHFMDTDRAREFARAIVAAAESGQLDPAVAARSKRRVKNLLERAQMNVVKALPDRVFRAHA
ncbi:MAG: beta-N-acetylhexosaminidase, partial [Methylocapsa sp.]|nr:beta-N-acetylhexosaminidase [Methylocapsa sp.]